MEHEGQTFAGDCHGAGLRIAVVAGRFNQVISQSLWFGARDTLIRHGVAPKDIDLAWVPGAFEIPMVARQLAASGQYDAIICLGAVIRGATPHFDYVAGEAASGIARAAWDTHVPVAFGVLTTETVEQAMDRAGLKAGNKGSDAAMTALEMVRLCKKLPREAT